MVVFRQSLVKCLGRFNIFFKISDGMLPGAETLDKEFSNFSGFFRSNGVFAGGGGGRGGHFDGDDDGGLGTEADDDRKEVEEGWSLYPRMSACRDKGPLNQGFDRTRSARSSNVLDCVS